jgi:hypothetical protein
MLKLSALSAEKWYFAFKFILMSMLHGSSREVALGGKNTCGIDYSLVSFG